MPLLIQFWYCGSLVTINHVYSVSAGYFRNGKSGTVFTVDTCFIGMYLNTAKLTTTTSIRTAAENAIILFLFSSLIFDPFYSASAVGMPVTRHPPHSPGRAVFPHPVPRSYSLPRRTELSSVSSATDFGYARPCYLYPFEKLVELHPGETLPLPTSSIEPFVYRLFYYLEEVFQRPEHIIWHHMVSGLQLCNLL